MRNARTAAARVSGISPILLANCPQLANIDTHSLLELSRRSESRLVFEGEEIFRQGEEAASVFMLLDGAIDLERTNEDRTRSAYEVVAPQATFGDVVLLGEPTRRYTARAQSDSLVVEIPLGPIVEVLAQNPSQALAWRGAVLARLHRKEPLQAGGFGWKLLDKLSQVFQAA